MARVVLVGNLAQLTGGVTEFELAATSVKQLYEQLAERHPALQRHLQGNVAVAIDGQIYQDALLEPIGRDSEVFLLPPDRGRINVRPHRTARGLTVRPNRIKQMWRDGRCVTLGWLSVANGFTAEVMARQGFDALCVDMQHGLTDFSDLWPMLQAISQTDTVPVVRVPWNDPATIMKALDLGAYGIIVPLINTGERGGGGRGRLPLSPPWACARPGRCAPSTTAAPTTVAQANGEIAVMAMVETKEGLANLDAICATPGLDAVYIGPADLSFALGLTPRGDDPDPLHLATCDRIRETAHKHGIKACMHCASAAFAAGAVKRGFDLIMLTSDLASMIAGVRRQLDELKAAIP